MSDPCEAEELAVVASTLQLAIDEAALALCRLENQGQGAAPTTLPSSAFSKLKKLCENSLSGLLSIRAAIEQAK